MGQQWAGQSKDGHDSLRQLLLAHTCLSPGKGTQSHSLLFFAGVGAGRGQGALQVHAQLGQEWPQRGCHCTQEASHAAHVPTG